MRRDNSMGGITIAIVCILLFLAERVFFTRFEIFSITPWLVFSFIVAFAVNAEEPQRWIICASLCGLLEDIAGGGAIGTAMASYAVGVWAIHLFSVRIFHTTALFSTCIIFVMSIVTAVIYCTLNYGFALCKESFFCVILPLGIINTVIAMIIYPIAKRISEKRRYAV